MFGGPYGINNSQYLSLLTDSLPDVSPCKFWMRFTLWMMGDSTSEYSSSKSSKISSSGKFSFSCAFLALLPFPFPFLVGFGLTGFTSSESSLCLQYFDLWPQPLQILHCPQHSISEWPYRLHFGQGLRRKTGLALPPPGLSTFYNSAINFFVSPSWFFLRIVKQIFFDLSHLTLLRKR